MDTTGNLAKDESVVKRDWTIQRKNAKRKLDVQTVDYTIWLTQDFVTYLRKKELLKIKHKRRGTFLEARKIVGSCRGENILGGSNQSRQQILGSGGGTDPIGTK